MDPGSLRILLVDDSGQSLSLTKDMLLDLGVTQIYTAQNGVEGLDVLASFDEDNFIDAVLCDWNMPEMNGIELLRKIRRQDEKLLFIMITGQVDNTSLAEAKAVGANGFLKKPFLSDDLRKKLTVVSRIINQRNLDSVN